MVKQVTVGVGELYVTKHPDERLVTYALGTCLGVTVYDPAVRVAGMLHFMLPKSAINKERAMRQPGVFCDTGIPLLLKKASKLGAAYNRLIIKVAGGARLLNQGQQFDIGKKNYLILRKLLWKNNLMLAAEAVGGTNPRTLKMNAGTGLVMLCSTGNAEEEL